MNKHCNKSLFGISQTEIKMQSMISKRRNDNVSHVIRENKHIVSLGWRSPIFWIRKLLPMPGGKPGNPYMMIVKRTELERRACRHPTSINPIREVHTKISDATLHLKKFSIKQVTWNTLPHPTTITK